MDLKRRHFLRVGGLGLLAVACAPGRRDLFETAAPSSESPPPPANAMGAGDPLLVHVFLRGGADGLHLVPPTGDRGYEKLRGSLTLSETLPFAREFSLHPALASLAPLIERKQLAVVHAAGSPDPTRSHFEAQDIMELGAPGPARMKEGWLARALQLDGPPDEAAGRAPFATLALADQQPLSLRGTGAFAIGDAERFGLPGVSPRARQAVEALYRAGSDPVSAAGAQALESLHEYERAMGVPVGSSRQRLARRAGRPGGKGPGGGGLERRVDQLLAIERSGLGVRVACLEGDGWDTHTRQGLEQGPMATRIGELGRALARLDAGLGEQRDWLAVVMTEFGRTVRPNGSGGSDHGHGGAILVAGPRVRGGVYGDWAGLSAGKLYEDRDLPVLTDWRSVLGEVLTAHLRNAPPPDTFPGFTPESLGILA